MSGKKLVKRKGMLFGVCAGLGEHFDMDPTIIRLIFAVLFFGFGTGGLIYLIMAIVMPKGY